MIERLAAGLAVAILAACERTPEPVAVTQADSAQPPNVLLIVADDLGWSDIGAFGGEIPTPNLDGLAESGLMLTSFHTAPTCSPSRAMLMTGRDNHEVGLGSMAELLADNQRGQPGYEGFLSAAPTLAEVLAGAGYHTLMAGKWHLGSGAGQLPSDRGFAKTFALLDAAGSHFSDAGFMPGKPVASYTRDGQPATLPDDYYSSDTFTDVLIEGIGQIADLKAPFFAYAAYTAPHYPLQAPQAWIDRFSGKYDSGWDDLRARRWQALKAQGLVPASAEMPPRHSQVPAWASLDPATQQAQARRMEVYAAMVANLDWNIGRLLGALEAQGLRDDTVVIFISDNGAEGVDYTMVPGFSEWFREHFELGVEHVGQEGSYAFQGPGWAQVSNTPWRDFKGVVSEGGVRVPAIIATPDPGAAGGRVGSLTSIRDIFATVLDLAGLDEVEPPMGSVSLAALLQDPAVEPRASDAAVGLELLGHRALYKGRWKALSLRPPWGDGDWQLYDLHQDPFEQSPMQEKHPQALDALVADYEAWASAHGVIPPPPGPLRYPRLPPLQSWGADEKTGLEGPVSSPE